MKSLTSALLLFLGVSALSSQTIPIRSLAESKILLASEQKDKSIFPRFFEENDSSSTLVEGSDTIRLEYFSRYTDRRSPFAKGVRKTLFGKERIALWVNDTLRIDLKRYSSDTQAQILGSVGKSSFLEIPSGHPTLPARHQYTVDTDTNALVMYRPELQLIEIVSAGNMQYKRMIGSMFQQATSNSADSQFPEPLNRTFKNGDCLEILFQTRSLSEDAQELILRPVHLMHIEITQESNPDFSPVIPFQSHLVDLEYGTIYGHDEGFIELFPEGMAIHQSIFLSDVPAANTIELFPSPTETYLNPFFPGAEIEGPFISATWSFSNSLGDTTFTANSYWNSSEGARLSYLPVFPMPWRDNGENYTGSPRYLKLNGISYGNETWERPAKDLCFKEVRLRNDSLEIQITSSKNANIRLELVPLPQGETVSLKQSHGIRKGNSTLKFQAPAWNEGDMGELVVYEQRDGKWVEKQIFRYIHSSTKP